MLAAVNPVAGVRGTIPGVYFAIEIVVLPVLEKLNHMVGKRELQNTTEPMVKEVRVAECHILDPSFGL